MYFAQLSLLVLDLPCEEELTMTLELLPQRALLDLKPLVPLKRLTHFFIFPGTPSLWRGASSACTLELEATCSSEVTFSSLQAFHPLLGLKESTMGIWIHLSHFLLALSTSIQYLFSKLEPLSPLPPLQTRAGVELWGEATHWHVIDSR